VVEWVACEFCNEWYHRTCTDMDIGDQVFICRNCNLL
jgi:hypothetical protein